MRSRPETYAIVGAGLAGGTAAATLRANGFAGRVVLIGAEPHPPYERPPLSKQLLRGEPSDPYLRPHEFYAEQGIECRFGTAARSLDAQRHRVVLGDGDEVAYDKVLVANGLTNRVLPGTTLEGIHYLRTIDDAVALREAITAASRAVVVGMGFIGAEVAAALRMAGVDVTVIEPMPGPAYAALGREGSAVVEAIHAEHGVTMLFGQSAQQFHGGTRVEAVTTSGGQRIDCDLAVIGVGTVADTALVEGTGVAIDDGIVVDEYCRTSTEDVFAAGDIARHPSGGRQVRVEHWENALKQGEAAALNMLGIGRPYTDVHWFWSDQYRDNIQVAGRLSGWEHAVIRGDLAARRFVAFFLEGNRVYGALAVNLGRDLRRGLPLLQATTAVDPAVLSDPAADVRSAALPS